MIYLDKVKGVWFITYMIGDKIQLKTQRSTKGKAKAYAEALAKKYKVKFDDKDNAKSE